MLKRKSQVNVASSVGLEITPTTLRAVEVRLHARQTIIERLAETETPEGSVLNGRVTDPEAVGYALRRLWDRAGFSTRRCVAAIPVERLTQQMLTLPPAPPKEQRLIARGELQRFAPMEENTPFGWLPMTAGGGPSGNTLAFVGERELIAGYEQALRAAGLEVDACEPDVIGLLRAVGLGLPGEGAAAVVCVGQTGSELAFLEAGRVRYCRRLDTGITELDGRASESGAAPTEAEDPELARFLASQESVSALHSDTDLDPLSLEIKRSLQYYARSYHEAPQPDRLLLLGDDPALAPLAAVIQAGVGLPVELVHPPREFNHRGEIADTLAESALRYSVALGMALRPLDDPRAGFALDLKAREESQRVGHTPRFLLVSSATSAALVVLMLLASNLFTARLGEVQSTLKAAEMELELANTQREMALARAAKAKAETNRLRKEALPIPNLLVKLGGKVPQALSIISLHLKEDGTLMLEGEARAPQQVNSFIQALSWDPGFQDPSLASLDAASREGASRFRVQTGLVGYVKQKAGK